MIPCEIFKQKCFPRNSFSRGFWKVPTKCQWWSTPLIIYYIYIHLKNNTKLQRSIYANVIKTKPGNAADKSKVKKYIAINICHDKQFV